MHGMGSVAQRIQNQVIESAKQLEGRRRHGTEVGEIGERAHAESVYGNRAMLCGYWNNAQSKEVEGSVECMNFNLRNGTFRGLRFEDVRESAAQNGLCLPGGVYGDR